MLGCDGLIGRVDFASDAEMHQDLEVMIFNDQGLLVRHYDSRSGLDDTYAYNFNPENGYELISKTDAHGKVVKYSTKWNEVGDMLEVAGSDGSMIGYARDYDYVKRVIHFNGRKPVKTDYYDNSFMIDKSVAGNTNLSYYYNSDGDIAAAMFLTVSCQRKPLQTHAGFVHLPTEGWQRTMPLTFMPEYDDSAAYYGGLEG